MSPRTPQSESTKSPEVTDPDSTLAAQDLVAPGRRVGGGFLDPKMLWKSLPDAFLKLDPRVQIKNPVMFVVEIGSVLTVYDAIVQPSIFAWTITAWLWITVLFANLAEVIPGDGEVVDGIASVDESAITGKSAPVIRESGGDRSAVTGGTKVLSDQIIVRITSKPGETFIDRMIALVEGASRQKTPNELALNILLASLTLIFVLAVVTLQPMAYYSKAPQDLVILVALIVALIPTTIGALLSAIG